MVFLVWFVIVLRSKSISVSLPEWSKGLRSGRNVFERVGSYPTADISFYAQPHLWQTPFYATHRPRPSVISLTASLLTAPDRRAKAPVNEDGQIFKHGPLPPIVQTSPFLDPTSTVLKVGQGPHGMHRIARAESGRWAMV